MSTSCVDGGVLPGAMFRTRAYEEGVVIPLPPTAVGDLKTSWIHSPEETGNTLAEASKLAELLKTVQGDPE
ncbi:hypothetical protein GCM10009660_37270 [Catellatospora bangladeshensis]